MIVYIWTKFTWYSAVLQLGRGVYVRRYFQIVEKVQHKYQKFVQSILNRKLIHKIPVNQNQFQATQPQLIELIKQYYSPQIANNSRFKSERKVLVETNQILIIELDREAGHINQRSPSAIIQKQLKVSDIMPECYKNGVYSLSAVISTQVRDEKELHSVQFFDYHRSLWLTYDGESLEKISSSNFPSAAKLFYELSGKQ